MFTLVLFIAFVVIFAGVFQTLYMCHIFRTMCRSVSVYCLFPLACTCLCTVLRVRITVLRGTTDYDSRYFSACGLGYFESEKKDTNLVCETAS
jgi:hypothetical protein